jgi:hypothetical protein
MENRKDVPFVTSLELRKQLLVTRGAMYRSGILSSREKVIAGLQAESLAKSAIKQICLAALSLWRGGSGLGVMSVPAFAPILIRGVSSLWRARMLKPLARGAIVVATIASVVTILTKKKKTSASSKQTNY